MAKSTALSPQSLPPLRRPGFCVMCHPLREFVKRVLLLFAFGFFFCVCASRRFSLGKWSKGMAMALVFIVSSIIHEQIIACAIGAQRA